MFQYKPDASLCEGDVIGRYCKDTLVMARVKKLETYQIWCEPITDSCFLENDEGLFSWEGYYIRVQDPKLWERALLDLWSTRSKIEMPEFKISLTGTIIDFSDNGTFKFSIPNA